VIESQTDYNNFLKETDRHNLIIQVVPFDDKTIHACVSKLSAVLVKDLETDKTYTISVKHPDCLFNPDLQFLFNTLKTGKIWCLDKKSAFNFFPIPTILDVDLFTHLKKNWMIDYNKFETTAHKLIKRNNPYERSINNVIPLLKHQEMFDNICDEIRCEVDLNEKLDIGYLKETSTVIDTLARLEAHGIHVNKECFKKHFDANVYDGNLVYSQYNIYTATGRPSNRFDGVNYAALNKSDGVRKCFTSRWGEDGKMVLIDYSAFHPRIISYLIKFPLGIDTDIYQYLGELYFGRKVTEYDMDEIKSITMRQFYGGVEEKYQHIKYLSHARDFIEKYWNEWKQNGCIYTPLFKRVITNQHLKDANPYKLLNYILQATETEIAISVLEKVIDYTAFHKIKPVLYTYDSILFDFYKSDGKSILDGITNIMKMGNRFPIKIYEGDSYDSIVQIST